MVDSKKDSILDKKYYIVVFKMNRKEYFIERNNLNLTQGDFVVVQAEKGTDLGFISHEIDESYMPEESRRYPLEILRKATEEDKKQLRKNREEEEEAKEICNMFIDFRGLDMKLVYAEYQFDRSKLTFYFTAEHRVDFRELVKDLAAYYRTRIQLRQIGVRDEAKRVSGLAPCGRQTCCSKHLKNFESIPTKFARDQNLSVNPGKLSGLCGRLMCCLAFEEDFYNKAAKQYPDIGSKIETDEGKMEVDNVNFLKKEITLIEEGDGKDRARKRVSLNDYKKMINSKQDFLEKWKD